MYVSKSRVSKLFLNDTAPKAEEFFFSYASQPCESALQNNSHNGTIEKALVSEVYTDPPNTMTDLNERKLVLGESLLLLSVT